jgi:hypothetical protein
MPFRPILGPKREYFHFSKNLLKSPGNKVGTREICAAAFPSLQFVFILGDIFFKILAASGGPKGAKSGEIGCFGGCGAGIYSRPKDEIGHKSAETRPFCVIPSITSLVLPRTRPMFKDLHFFTTGGPGPLYSGGLGEVRESWIVTCCVGVTW